MKDYKRLTKRCGDIVNYAKPLQSNFIGAIYEEQKERDSEIMNRLAELEDKIESGELCEQGYRKLPENSVVLSKEELAQKIYDDIFAILKIKLWLYGDDAMTKSLNGLTKQKILDFTKKWGIKDNHLNEKDYSHIDHLQVHDKQIKEQASKETAKEIAEMLKSAKGVVKVHFEAYDELIENIYGKCGIESVGNSDKLEDEK